MVSKDGTQFLWLLWIPTKNNPPQTYLGECIVYTEIIRKPHLICSNKESLEAQQTYYLLLIHTLILKTNYISFQIFQLKLIL